jgi:hypothetical protein
VVIAWQRADVTVAPMHARNANAQRMLRSLDFRSVNG